MQITSAKFMRGVAGTDDMLGDGKPHVAFLGRSNVGKSSIINSLTGNKGLARISDTPGLTQKINIYEINRSLYLLDLPGYGYAKASPKIKEQLQKLIYWYLFNSPYQQKKTVLVIDANIGPTDTDLQMLQMLQENQKPIVVVANKIDKIKKSEYDTKLAALAALPGNPNVIPYSAQKKIGVGELMDEILR